MVVRVPYHQAVIIQAAIEAVPVRVVHSAAEVLEAVALREVGKMALVDVSLVAVIVLSITMTLVYGLPLIEQIKNKKVNIIQMLAVCLFICATISGIIILYFIRR